MRLGEQMVMRKSKYVTLEQEAAAINGLARSITDSKWVDNDTTIVTCDPLFSSYLAQSLNHKINQGELLDSLFLEIPQEGMRQVFNKETFEYEFFDRYLYDFVNKYVEKDRKYLFVDIGIKGVAQFGKIKSLIKDKCKDYRLCVLYKTRNEYEADYIGETALGDISFSWQYCP